MYVISALATVFRNDRRIKTTADYALAKVLVTHTELHKYCQEQLFYNVAKAYPKFASTILAKAGDKLSAVQKRKTPGLPRQIINNTAPTMLRFLTNLVIMPVYLLAGLVAF